MRKIRWVPVVLVVMVSAACAEAKEPSKPSLLDDLPQLAPVIACIDAAPLDDEAALRACVERTGLPLKDIAHEPKSLNDFKANVLILWIVTNRGADRQKNTASFAEAIDYARCVEKFAYSDKEFSSRTEKGVAAVRARAELHCKDHPLSLRGAYRREGTLPPRTAVMMFASGVANMALNYALEANGWFPDEMRPCFRYGDGRPPSAGCAGKPEPRIPPPPRLSQ